MSCNNCGPSKNENMNGQVFTEVGNPQMDNGSALYQIPYGTWKGKTYVDFDASSGLMCGNSWGKPSKQAEIIYNILSFTAPTPIIQDREIYTEFIKTLYYDNGLPPTNTSWQTKLLLQPSICYGVENAPTMWGVGMNYVGGFMGLPYGSHISWGHYGETYGYTSLTQFFDGRISGFSGILAGNDIVFVAAQNSDTKGQIACGNAIESLIIQLSNPAKYGEMKSEDQIKKSIEDSITYAYCDKSYCGEPKTQYTSYPGMTMTIGYFFIDSSGISRNGSSTMSVINGVLKVPQKEYPFKDSFIGSVGGREPAYYFGSGTKPITAAITTNALVVAWKKSNNKVKFVDWYMGSGVVDQVFSTFGAVNMSDILQLKDSQSYYLETIQKYTNSRDINNIGNPSFTTSTNTIQDWYSIIYGSDACLWKGLSQDDKRCPTNSCYEITDSKGNSLIDPTSTGCSCSSLLSLQNIFMNNLTPVSLINMKAGIPDADTISTSTTGLVPSPDPLQLDYIDQIVGRTSAIGPMNYVRELIGFNWIPGWNKDNTPISKGFYNNTTTPAQYSSSGYTLLGTILWILDPNGPKSKDKAINWSEIKINESFLPLSLLKNTNFAGTSGNGGSKYFVSKGSQPQSGVLSKCNVANEKRKECIITGGADKNTCLSNSTCCYQPNNVIIDGNYVNWCYKKN